MPGFRNLQDLAALRVHEAAWQAHALLRAYVVRDRGAIVGHPTHLEDDQLEFARGMTANFCNDTLTMPQDVRRPCRPASLGR
ncbi:hypothetical protein [Streptomyces sp. NPDC059003]|uniref:hypothetical protein n=1 Tax=Streptomyces sp. NPDC059003 TaxID=3346691 RepID=UPI0036ABE78F